MRPCAVFGLCLAVLSACTPLNLYYQEGASVTRITRDEASCRNEALRLVPVDTRTRYISGTKAPRTICNAAGYCQTVWMQITPDRIETYDANEGARLSYARNCMIAKGYERVRLPACPPDVVEATPLARTTILPPLTGNSCAIRLEGGGWQVVSPPG